MTAVLALEECVNVYLAAKILNLYYFNLLSYVLTCSNVLFHDIFLLVFNVF